MPPTDPYGRQLLEKIAEETDENNKMLKGIQSYVRWSRFYTWFKVIIIVSLLGVSYYQLRPYFNIIQSGYYSVIETGRALLNFTSTLNATEQGAKNLKLPTTPGIQNILNKVKIPSEAPETPVKQ
jgi:hypothetical protein